MNQDASSPYAKGWYRFEVSEKIKKEKVYTLNYFGTSFVCFRNSQNEVNIFDAYCPHLGAHLGMGGKIKQDQLICPFHGWKYNSAGECVDIPYCQKIPKRARLRAYPAKECHSFVYFYFDQSIESNDPDCKDEELQVLSEIPCKHLFSMRMVNWKFQKLIALARSTFFNLTQVSSGLFITESNMMGIRFVITATPINHNVLSVSFAHAIKKTINYCRVCNMMRTAKKKFKVLLNATETS